MRRRRFLQAVAAAPLAFAASGASARPVFMGETIADFDWGNSLGVAWAYQIGDQTKRQAYGASSHDRAAALRLNREKLAKWARSQSLPVPHEFR